jgi:hypothetical protein
MVSIAVGGVVCLGADHHAPHGAGAAAADFHGDAPCCPGTGHSDGDHCQSCLSCPCHAPLAGDLLQFRYSPSFSLLSFVEHHTAPPDVYLPKFVPPQNLA